MFTLIIDGNFFAQRLRNAISLNFIDNPPLHKQKLIEGAATSLALEISSLSNIIENVIICRDWSSWRKKHEQIVPIESIKTKEQEVYKENRGKNLDYDSAAFYEAYDTFCKLCEEKLNIAILRSYGAEGDDMLYIVSRILKKLGKMSLLWSSDGDYVQTVDDTTYLLKFPKRQLFMKHQTQVEAKPKTMMDVFNQKTPDRSTLLIENYAKTDVIETNPYKSLLMKIISGDSKDNVMPIFFWKKGTRTYKPAPGHIKKAFAQLNNGIDLDTIDETFLYNDDMLKLFIQLLLKITKQKRDVEHTLNVFKSNRKMKMLSTKEIPKEIVESCVEVWKSKRHLQTKIKLASNYQQILQEFNITEKKSFFSGFDLNNSTK